MNESIETPNEMEAPSSQKACCSQCCPRTWLRVCNVIALSLLFASSVFFMFFDLFHVHIIWSLAIYIPCMMLFAFGIWAWCSPSKLLMVYFAAAMSLVDIFLIVYGVILLAQGDLLWGPTTLGFAMITSPLTAFALRRKRLCP